MKFCLISQLILNVTGLLSFLILILLWSSSFPNVEEGAGEGVGGPWRLEARSIAFLVISVTMVVLLSLNSLCLFDLVYRWRSDCECPRTKSLLSVLRGGRKTEPADELFFHQEDRLVRDSPTISGKDLTVVKLLHPTREEIFLSSTNESLDKAIGQGKCKQLMKLSASGCLIFGGICFYKGDDRFYSRLLMPVVHGLLDGEQAHQLALSAARFKLLQPGQGPKKTLLGDEELKKAHEVRLNTTVLGLNFENPVGMAAGFDKDGVAVPGLAKVGFGFVEVGSVTPLPQPGNEKPRVFRLFEDEAVINRYGFNSHGHSEVYDRLSRLTQFSVRIGVNLGKNKISQDPAEDYVQGVRLFGPVADYLVINVSSPNTPGLRKMQGKEELEGLLIRVLKERNCLKRRVPILIKVAPDLTEDEKKSIADVATRDPCRVDGLIVSNTTISRPETLKSAGRDEQGGLSGRPLAKMSTQAIYDFYRLTQGRVPIIGVGGIFSGKDAYEKLCAGASLVQIYSAFVYHGSPVTNRILRELQDEMRQHGDSSIDQIVGKSHKRSPSASISH